MDEAIEVCHLKPGQYILLGDNPCLILENKKIHIGKLGGHKYALKTVDIFTGKEKLDYYLHQWGHEHARFVIPEIDYFRYQLLDIDPENHLILLDESTGEIGDTYLLPEGALGEKIRKEFGQEQTVYILIRGYKNKKIVYNCQCSKY